MPAAASGMFPAALQQRRQRRRRSALHRCAASAAVLAAALTTLLAGASVSFLSAAGPQRSGRPLAASVAAPSQGAAFGRPRPRGDGRQLGAARAAGTSGAWILPSVDKDVTEFHSGRASNYAWLQTSESMFIFALYTGKEGEKPNVQLEMSEDGTSMKFVVEGQQIINGELSHAFKPGAEVWMVEEAADGTPFVVIEADKQAPGIEWHSVVKPVVTFQDDYTSKFNLQLPQMTYDQRDAAVSETLKHLQRKHSKLQVAPEGHAAEKGDMVTLDIQGFELTPDGERGAPLDVGTAKGVRPELGATGRAGAGFPPEVHDQLVGIAVGEERDVKVTLGNRAGDLGGQTIICAVTCTRMQVQERPALDDEFARTVKRAEQMIQAGTIEGIPEEEQGAADTITLAQLKSEIENEITYASQQSEKYTLWSMLEAEMLKHVNVDCDWATPRTHEHHGDPERFEYEERVAAMLEAVAEREGLVANIDFEKVEKETWDTLGTPKQGQTMAEVGKDPAREYQEARRKVSREHYRNHVLGFLAEQAEVSPVEAVAA